MHPPRAFATTRWSLVLAAADRRDSRSREALAELLEAYWYPLYAFARRAGAGHDDAADLVQGFFTYLLSGQGLASVDPSRGRFRSYLLGAFQHYAKNRERHENAIKRGGDVDLVSLDISREDAERRFAREPVDERTPERVYERRWALTVLDHALERLRREHERAGKLEVFEALKPRLTGAAERGAGSDVAKRLGMTDGSLRVAVHRLRKRFGILLREEVRGTLERDADVEDELRYLMAALEA